MGGSVKKYHALMRWLDALERRFGDWAIPDFPLFIALAPAGIYILSLSRPEFINRLTLDPAAIRAGELWRVFTFLFLPPWQNLFWLIIWLFVTYQFAKALEQAWGAFRFCFFYLFGAFVTALAAVFIINAPLSNASLNTSLFLAFATLYPDVEVLLFFIIPLKVKYLAWVTWAAIALSFILGDTISRVGIAASLANYLLFFGPSIWRAAHLKWDVYRNRRRLGR
jgi:membrane associated rhomboid family serine protease